MSAAPDLASMGPNETWRRRSVAAVWHPGTPSRRHESRHSSRPLTPISRAEGVWLHDFEGRRVLDGISSWWVNLFGHNHPAIREALVDQLGRIHHVMLAGCTHATVVELSERLAALTGLGHASYASDGACAIEIALKMSAHYWRNAGLPAKCRFVGMADGYHGETIGALGLTDIDLYRHAYEPLIRVASTVPSPDARQARDGRSADDVAHRAADEFDAWAADRHERIAAFVVEPLVQCGASMGMHSPVYLRRVRETCDRYDIHLVCDEIAVGFGRTGSMFAHQQAGVRPDFLCLSKGLTGGTLPLSVVLTTDDIHRAFQDRDVARNFLHSHSYTGNALACRAALATLDLFEQTDALRRNEETGARLAQAFEALSRHARVRHPRRQGMIFAWDVECDLPEFASRYARHALAHGVLLRPIGRTVYAMPPFVISPDEIDHLANGALAALEATLAEDSSGCEEADDA